MILATVARNVGLINDRLFVALVIMALVTSILSGLIMNKLNTFDLSMSLNIINFSIIYAYFSFLVLVCFDFGSSRASKNIDDSNLSPKRLLSWSVGL